MRMIYLDESGRGNQFYFFGALIADAAAIRSIETGLDGVANLIARHVQGFDPETEFHGVDMFQGKNAWSSVPPAWRVKACELTAKVLARSSARYVFRGVDLIALRKKYAYPYPHHLLTLAQILERVDRSMSQVDLGEKLGIVHADEHHAAQTARRSLRDFKRARVPGFTTRQLTAIADTIYFGPSHESRLLQAADVATYFINRDRTIYETDARSARAVSRIAAHIRSITLDEYVWSPF